VIEHDPARAIRKRDVREFHLAAEPARLEAIGRVFGLARQRQDFADAPRARQRGNTLL